MQPADPRGKRKSFRECVQAGYVLRVRVAAATALFAVGGSPEMEGARESPPAPEEGFFFSSQLPDIQTSDEQRAACASSPSGQWQCPSYPPSKGPPIKKKSVTPVVGGSEYEKGLGSDLFFSIFLIVFLNSPYRETPKNVIKKKSRKRRFWIFGRFFCRKLFDTILFAKRFL
jgi:hypothetical protein